MFSDGYIVISSKSSPDLFQKPEIQAKFLDALNGAVMVYYDVPKKYGDVLSGLEY